MNARGCPAPIADAVLVDYWLDDLEPAACGAIDNHLLGCGDCTARLGELVTLADGIRSVFRKGMVRAFVTDRFVQRLAEQRTRVREYRVARGGSVHCSVAPDDDVVIARLEAPLDGVTQVDAELRVEEAPPELLRDVPFDAARGEVVLMSKIAWLRPLPAHRQRIRLLAVDGAAERVLGDYTFDHTPWRPRSADDI